MCNSELTVIYIRLEPNKCDHNLQPEYLRFLEEGSILSLANERSFQKAPRPNIAGKALHWTCPTAACNTAG